MDRFAGNFTEWLMVLHILAAMVWVGGVAALSVLVTLVLRRSEREGIAWFIGSLRIIGPLVLAPAMLATISLGIWIVLVGSLGFNQFWILLALALFFVAFLIGVLFQSRAAIRAERAVNAEDSNEAVRQLRRWSWGMRLILLLLVVVTWDMVVRPSL